MQHLKKYLEYIRNTGGVTPAQFDDDWEPIGPTLRAEIVPRFASPKDGSGRLTLTLEGDEIVTGIYSAHSSGS
jgi:hypothetical protein